MEEIGMKQVKTVIAAVIVTLIGMSISVYAAPRQSIESALVYLQKARTATTVQVKIENLKNANDQIAGSKYSKGGYCAAAMGLITQAMTCVNESSLDMANKLIDSAMVKVKHALQAIKQEEASQSKAGGR
jgi:hypothetical protein